MNEGGNIDGSSGNVFRFGDGKRLSPGEVKAMAEVDTLTPEAIRATQLKELLSSRVRPERRKWVASWRGMYGQWSKQYIAEVFMKEIDISKLDQTDTTKYLAAAETYLEKFWQWKDTEKKK